jgi:hypothetical protein
MSVTTTEFNSTHEIMVYAAVARGQGEWLDRQEIVDESGVQLRTVHKHLTSFVEKGIMDEVRIHPKALYRLRPDDDMTVEEIAMMADFDRAWEILGV